jgi:hypothetical protein
MILTEPGSALAAALIRGATRQARNHANRQGPRHNTMDAKSDISELTRPRGPFI